MWVTCFIKNNRISIGIWIGHYYITIHTSHAFRPLDVSCFKPFKIAFKKERDNVSNKFVLVKNNHYKLINVDKTLDQSLSRKNIKNGFGGARI